MKKVVFILSSVTLGAATANFVLALLSLLRAEKKGK